MIVPLISSSVTGRLGLAHLPRLWCKLLLHACGELPEGYRAGHGGFDESICETIGVDRDALVAFVHERRPSYVAFETWIGTHATRLDVETVDAWNARVRAADLPDAMATERRARFDIPATERAAAVRLNDLDDWDTFHRALTRRGDET
ncbi:MAG: hypothetical protein NVS3B17_11230 [Vulcanimicrobiaceae bacterium]